MGNWMKVKHARWRLEVILFNFEDNEYLKYRLNYINLMSFSIHHSTEIGSSVLPTSSKNNDLNIKY